MNSPLLILIQLLLAHILTDFVLQPTSWVEHKRERKATSGYLYVHSIIAGLLTYLLLQKWHLWLVPVVISVSHFLIDWWKLQQKKDNLKIFLLDQFFHMVVILMVWLVLADYTSDVLPFLTGIMNSERLLLIISAYLFVIFPVGFIIGKATARWQNEISDVEERTGLQDAGLYIGIFERILVLTFILTGYFSAIGFLIAAKSILRFSDKTETGARKQTEYVLIGTLMSFAITILLGLLTYHITF
ncbi:DUF3307 domain-containing protein [Salinimicrobium sp. GXAS 041]|uniref:DUF3307 domain-containing protein n=1 Tax=Salinimicrobium sp. GXAS 041 TaxID=3400806 RepID=UPI003C72F5A7